MKTRAAYWLFIILLPACSTISPEPHYYTLGTPTSTLVSSTSNANYRISVGPIVIPEIVNRPQIVLEKDPNQVTVAEQHRWAQPLQKEISRALTNSLSQQLNGAWVTDSRQISNGNIDYQILVDVQRFESRPGEAAIIEALWKVRRTAGEDTKIGKSVVREATNGNSYDTLVAAHERAIVSMSREIAAVIRASWGK
ncbi:MAG: PqiC family protein [Pseudomonadota bacterium]